jgi:hypothetical protein
VKRREEKRKEEKRKEEKRRKWGRSNSFFILIRN